MNDNSMIRSILLGYVRHGLTIAAGYLLAHGLIQQADQQVFISGALALAGVAWSTLNQLFHEYELRNARKPPVTNPAPKAS